MEYVLIVFFVFKKLSDLRNENKFLVLVKWVRIDCGELWIVNY